MNATEQRLDFIEFVLSKEGTPYLWAGKGLPDPMTARGFDCSGLVTAGIYVATRGKLDLRAMWNAQRLFDGKIKKDEPAILLPTDNPKPGDLAFYGPGKNMVNHVMIWLGDGRVYGACGGNSDNKTIEHSIKKGARVRFRGTAHRQHQCLNCSTRQPCAKKFDGAKYRPDFLGFRTLPF